MFDRFDIVEAYYIYYRDFHNGQWSKEYKRLCHIKNYFTPSINLSYETLTENRKSIYNNLVGVWQKWHK